MRIALIAPPWYTIPPSGYGGIEWVVALLADGLTERGHEVTLFAAPGSDTKARLVSPLDEEPPREAIGDPWYEASHIVSRYQHGDQFDILHYHTGPVGVSVGALSNWPNHPHPARALHPADADALPARRPPALVRGHLREPALDGPARPPLGRCGLQRHPDGELPFREEKDDYLFFLGRADEEKAPHLAIQAARRAGRRLVMCATTKNDRERSYWAANVEPILGDDVTVVGECAPDQKADLLGRAAALLFPIQWAEPFGLVMTEAMACGTPVVAWRNGSVPEVVADGETGFVVESVDEMAAAIDRVGELDPHLMRSRVEERFSAEAMVSGYERAYEFALAGERAAAD